MILKYIYIGCDDSLPKDFCNIFDYNTRFISNWMSKNVRKLKILTNGSFNHINVLISKNESQCKKIIPDILEITTKWSSQRIKDYLGLKDERSRIDLYLDLLKDGLIRASEYDNFNVGEILVLIDRFKQNGCKNEWQLKSMYIKEWNIRFKITCHFSTYDFKLFMSLYDKSKKQIAQKEVFRIYPDEIYFADVIRKIIVENDKLFINDFLDKHFMSFDLNLLKDGIIEEKLLNERIKKFMYEANVDEYNKIHWL